MRFVVPAPPRGREGTRAMSSALAASPLRLLPTLAELRSLVVDYVELDDLFALALSCSPLRATVCLRGGAFARFPNGLRADRAIGDVAVGAAAGVGGERGVSDGWSGSRYSRTPWAARSDPMGEEQRLPVGCLDLLTCGVQRSLGGAAVGTREWLRVGPSHLWMCGDRRSLGGAAVGTGAWLRVGRSLLLTCGVWRSLGGAAVGEGQRLPVGPPDIGICGWPPGGAAVGFGQWLPDMLPEVDCSRIYSCHECRYS